jgi:hypothetical protein
MAYPRPVALRLPPILISVLLLTGLSACSLFESTRTAQEPPKPTKEADTTREAEKPDQPTRAEEDSIARAKRIRDSLDRLYPRRKPDTLQVAMILPLYAEQQLDTLTTSPRINKVSRIARQFYRGSRMALDSLESCGMHIRLKVFDSRNDSFRIKAIREKLKRDSTDLILGPFFSEHVRRLSSFAKRTRTNLVSPLANVPQCLKNNPYYIAMEPGKDVIARQIADLVHRKFQSANFYVVRKYAKRERQIANRMDSLVDTSEVASYQQIPLKENQYNNAQVFRDTLSPRRNVIFIPSTDEAFSTAAISGIQGADTIVRIDSIYGQGDTAKTEYLINETVTIIGLQDWLDYGSLDGTIMEQFRIHFLSDYYVNYSKLSTADFVRRYRRTNHTEPSEYAIKGYDFTLMLGKLISQYGIYFQREWEDLTLDSLHTRFDFEQEEDQRGWQNYYLQQLLFQNYELKKVNR